MFKRIEKRRKKKEEEDQLGLDEDMKDVLGIQDTDSDETDSDSDLSASAAEIGDDDDEDRDGGESHEGIGSDGNDEDRDTMEEPPITVGEALRDPLYNVSLQPEIKACIVCPGKLLKGAKMVDIHRKSNAHERRVRQFTALATEGNPDSNAWDVLQRNSEKSPKLSLTTATDSKRAEKRRVFKAKRDKRKAKAKAEKYAKIASGTAELESKVEEPSKKKRKVEKPVAEQKPNKKFPSVSSLKGSQAITQKRSPPTPDLTAGSRPDHAKKVKLRALHPEKDVKVKASEGKSKRWREGGIS